MARMKERMILRATPGGAPSGHEAPNGSQVDILERDATPPGFLRVKVLDAEGRPEGWVAADSVDEGTGEPGEQPTSIDTKEFAKNAGVRQ